MEYKLLVLLLTALLTSPSNSAEANLSWTPPTQNEDGSPLTDLASYEIWHGCNQSGVYDTVEVILAPASTHIAAGLPDVGTCYFAAIATNSVGVSSLFSNEAVKLMGALQLPGVMIDTAINWTESQACTDCVDFTIEMTLPFDGQDKDSDFTILNGGASIRLDNNTWRQTETTYTLTLNTVVEFTFESSVQGEIQGLGFTNNNTTESRKLFRLYGTQAWGHSAFNDYLGSGPQAFTIPVGQYFTGIDFHLVLANDDDSGVGANATFSNIRIYESVGE